MNLPKDLEVGTGSLPELSGPGLLSRVLVEQDGPIREARPGGVDMAIAHVASVVASRRIVFSGAKARARASTPGGSVLARHLQAEVERKVNHAWRQTAQGQIYVQKAIDIAKQAAENQKNAGKGARGQGGRWGPPVLRRPARRKLGRGQTTTGLRRR